MHILWVMWTTDALKSIGMFIPLVSLVLILRVWRSLGWEMDGSWWGFAILVATAVVVQMRDRSILILVLSPQWQISLPPPPLVVFAYGAGVVLLFGGTRLFRAALFPLVLLFFVNPVPHIFNTLIDLPLQRASAHVARSFAIALGQPLSPDQLRLMFTPDFGMFIAPGCNGIRGAVTMGFIALVAGYVYRFRWYAHTAVVTGAVLLGYVFNFAGPLHLWFLEYLIVLYVLAAVAVALVPLVLSPSARQSLLQAFRRIVLSPWAPLVLAVPSFAAQLLMPNPWIEDPPGFMPVFRIVVVYAIPFAFGWLLFLERDLLDVLIRRAWLYAALAVVASIAYLLSYGLPLDRVARFYLIRAVHSLDMWLLILGVSGLFLRYLASHSAWRRYLCDSSYFLYIAHMPVILAFQLLLKDVDLLPLEKMAVTLAGTVAILLPVYRWAVRPTFIGAVLNGRRYPSAIGPVLEGGPQLEDRRAQDAVR